MKEIILIALALALAGCDCFTQQGIKAYRCPAVYAQVMP